MNILICGKYGDFSMFLNVVKYYYDIGNDINLYLSRAHFSDYNFDDVYYNLNEFVKTQYYINNFNKHNGEHIDLDLTTFRNYNKLDVDGFLDIMSNLYGIKIKPEKWIILEDDYKFKNKILINRSLKNHNNNFPWDIIINEYKDDIIFICYDMKEYETFRYKNEIPCHKCNNFLELAQSINSCEMFIGNQSLCYSLAFSLNKKRLLEIYGRDLIRFVMEDKYYDNFGYYYDDDIKKINLMFGRNTRPTFKVYLDDNKINLMSDVDIYFCNIKIYSIDKQHLIYDEERKLDKNIYYWFIPDNKLYMNGFIVEIIKNNLFKIEKKVYV